ncbi:MAG: hypothetical protein AABW65_00110 [Nanoarchaeota archaeon]
MEMKYKVAVTFCFAVILIISLYLGSQWISKTTGYTIGEDNKVKLASCLKEKKSILYVSNSCLECEEQEKILGMGAEIIEKIMCEEFECEDIKETPAWKINGKIIYGVKSIKELSLLSGC